MSQSQTRRKGTEILRDEINAIIDVVKTHSNNLTRRLEKVRDLTVKYCAEKPRGSLAAATASLGPAAAAAPLPLPTPTIVRTRIPQVLNTIPEGNESEVSPVAVPVSLGRSRGPVSWDTFRSKVGEGTTLKTGKSNTLLQISTLWKQAKEGKPVGEIEKYLRNQLKIDPSVAAQKAPELEKIARNHVARNGKAPTSKRVTRTVKPNGSLGRVTASRKANKPVINPANESDDQFWQRMEQAASANNERKTSAALAAPAERSRVREQALAATRLAEPTPLKNRQVSLAEIPTLVPSQNSRANPKVVNPSTGEEEELSL
jgi:hypothetical protein